MSISNKIITLLLCAFLTISPFLFKYGFSSPYEFPKFIFVLIVAQIVAILFFITRFKFKFDSLTKLILIYLLIVMASNLLGLDPRTSLIGSSWRYQGFLLLLSGSILYFASRFFINKKLVELSIILSGFVLSFVTILEQNLINYGYHYPTYNGRLVATMGNPNFLAGYILLVTPFVLYSDLKNKYKYSISIFCFLAIFITQSRGAILGSIILITIFIFQKITYNSNLNKKIFAASGMIVIIFLIFSKILTTMYFTPPEDFKLTDFQRGIYCFYMVPDNIPGNFIILFFETHPQLLERTSFCESRFVIWSEGIKAIKNRPILGNGQENFVLIFPEKLKFNVDNAHNFFLETIISSGIIGLITLISIIYLGFRKTLLKYKLFLLTFLIISFFNPLFISGIILFWITLGLSNNNLDST